MSYSISARATTKEAVLEDLGKKFDEVIAGQPMHSNDRDQALAAARSFLDILPADPEGREFSVSMNGSIGWSEGAAGVAAVISGAGVSVSASLVSVT